MLRFLLFFMFLLISFAPVTAAVKAKNNRLIGITVVTGLTAIFIIPWIIGVIMIRKELPGSSHSHISFWGFSIFWAVMLFSFLLFPFISYGFGTLNGFQLLRLASYGGDGSGFVILYLLALAGSLIASLFLRDRNLFIGEAVCVFLVVYSYFFLGFSTFAILNAFSTMAAFGVFFQFLMLFTAIGFLYYGAFLLTGQGQPHFSGPYRQPVQNAAPRPYRQPISPLTVRCLNGDYAGAEFSLKEREQLIMGSDPTQANLIFSSPEISRLHCVIFHIGKPGVVRITDFSSNGTCLSGEKSLSKNVPTDVPLPCSISFGSEPQVFEIL